MRANSILPGADASRARQSRQPSARSEQRVAEVTRVAGQLFLEHGFDRVSLEMIVAQTGGSYREIYREFGGKEALFERVMQHMCKEILAPLRQALAGPNLRALPLREALTLLGGSVLKTLLAPSGLAFHRLMVSEAPRFPRLAKDFYRSGPANAYAGVTAFLSARAQADQLEVENLEAMAAVFVDSLVNRPQLKALTGGRVSKTEIEQHVQQVVRLFLDGALRRP